MASPDSIRVSIAQVVFEISSELPLQAVGLDRLYRDFVCAESPDVTVRLHYGSLPQLAIEARDLVFDSQAVWSLFRRDGQHIFTMQPGPAGNAPYCIAVFDEPFRQGDVYGQVLPDGRIPNLLEYPLAEVLMVCLLARQEGLMVHACGINDKGRGYLFAGNSTHGKSTMARLWRDQAVILNDDRIVLRPRDGRLWMYGTPWHGDYDGVSPLGVPLDVLFFLRHAHTNESIPTGAAQAAFMLLTRSFPPLWDAAGMQFTLDFCAGVAASVPCYDLGVVPDPHIVDFVRCVKSR